MPNVFEVLSNDHEQVRRMLTEFEAGVLKRPALPWPPWTGPETRPPAGARTDR